MSTTYTTKLGLQKPARSDRNWDVPNSANFDALDTLNPLAGLFVAPASFPSASLNVKVAAGNYRAGDGSVATYAGTASFAIAASSTKKLWLDGSGTLTSGAAFPSTAHVRLATVVSGASTITSITDERVPYSMSGTGLGFVLKAGDTMSGGLVISAGGLTITAGGIAVNGGTVAWADAVNVTFGTTTGTKLGTATTQKLGVWGATPIVRPSGFTQTYATSTKTLATYTPNSQSSAYTGQDNAQAGSVYAKLTDLNALRTAYENLRAFAENVGQVLNAVIDDDQSFGLRG